MFTMSTLAPEAVETKRREMVASPSFLFAMLGVVVFAMTRQPCTGTTYPLVEGVKSLVAEWRRDFLYLAHLALAYWREGHPLSDWIGDQALVVVVMKEIISIPKARKGLEIWATAANDFRSVLRCCRNALPAYDATVAFRSHMTATARNQVGIRLIDAKPFCDFGNLVARQIGINDLVFCGVVEAGSAHADSVRAGTRLGEASRHLVEQKASKLSSVSMGLPFVSQFQPALQRDWILQ
jgi:hypothetical protein